MKQLLERLREWMPAPSRIMAPFVYAGGKGHLARHLVRLFPRGDFRVYVEPFCGAASVFWHIRRPFTVEILNDLDQHLITLFRVLQDQAKMERLLHRLTFTPYARAEYERAWELVWGAAEPEDDVETAWAFFVALNQTWSGFPNPDKDDWRYKYIDNNGMPGTCSSWLGRIKSIEYFHRRLMRVQLECDDALRVIQRHDSEQTFFYLDPPYVPETRNMTLAYRHDQDESFHDQLVDVLLRVRGAVMLSGYPNPIYRRLEEAGWKTVDFRVTLNVTVRGRNSSLKGEGAVKSNPRTHRVERVWLNYNVPEQLTLFEYAAGDDQDAQAHD